MIEKVWKYIEQEHMIEEGDCVVAGVSGGADSVCLLLVLLELRKKIANGPSCSPYQSFDTRRCCKGCRLCGTTLLCT